MSAQRNLNSTARIREDALQEGPEFGDPIDRVSLYLTTTKTTAQIQAMRQELIELIQHPPIRKPHQSDQSYIQDYNERNAQAQRYEQLLSALDLKVGLMYDDI